jgi:hypothetical protein
MDCSVRLRLAYTGDLSNRSAGAGIYDFEAPLTVNPASIDERLSSQKAGIP